MIKFYYLDLFLSVTTFIVISSMTSVHNLVSFAAGAMFAHIIWTMLFKNKVLR